MFYRLLLILGIIAATVTYSLHKKNALESQLSPAGQTASILMKLPASSFTSLDGTAFGLHDLYKNEKVNLLVVHFWGTWCGPCEAELPELLAFINRFEGREGVKFLLVAVNDELAKVQKHIKRLPSVKGSATWLIDNSNVHRDQFGTTRVPETYVFSSDLTTLRKYIGPQEWNKNLFFQSFDEFIQISTRKL